MQSTSVECPLERQQRAARCRRCHYTVQSVQYCTVLECTPLVCIEVYCTVQYSTVLKRHTLHISATVFAMYAALPSTNRGTRRATEWAEQDMNSTYCTALAIQTVIRRVPCFYTLLYWLL